MGDAMTVRDGTLMRKLTIRLCVCACVCERFREDNQVKNLPTVHRSLPYLEEQTRRILAVEPIVAHTHTFYLCGSRGCQIKWRFYSHCFCFFPEQRELICKGGL